MLLLVNCDEKDGAIENASSNFVSLVFENESKNSDNTIILAEIVSYNPFKLKSELLIEISVTLMYTGIKSYGYALINNAKQFEIKNCYVLYGKCFVYGKLITGDNGDSLFFPATDSMTQYTHPDICPGDGAYFVK